MRRLYLLGYPLAHSISPAMQNAALRACGLDDWQYETLARPLEKMQEALAALRAPGCMGANVTIPHKQSIMPFLDELTETACAIGAVNTVLKREGKLIGENTDAAGFLQTLEAQHIHPRGTRAFIFGAGGAAAAVAFALAQAGAQEIVIVNRTPARAAELADRLRARSPQLRLAVNRWESFPGADFVVNASAVGMAPLVDASPLPDGRALPRGAVVLDLVYNPPETRLLREAAQVGARGIGGLEMLVYQGARAFELWTGRAAPLPVMRAAAADGLSRR